ncbi:hypothetical protein OKW45_006645 [Paraburkholderia sp. WSM4175]
MTDRATKGIFYAIQRIAANPIVCNIENMRASTVMYVGCRTDALRLCDVASSHNTTHQHSCIIFVAYVFASNVALTFTKRSSNFAAA